MLSPSVPSLKGLIKEVFPLALVSFLQTLIWACLIGTSYWPDMESSKMVTWLQALNSLSS